MLCSKLRLNADAADALLYPELGSDSLRQPLLLQS